MDFSEKEVPILLIAFNRPNEFKSLIQRLRRLEPKKIYIAIDGPRSDVKGEIELVQKTISEIQGIDWPCEIFTKIEESNLGCRYAPIEAMDWIFSNEDRAIILEDDIIPGETFFKFCSELLVMYESNLKVLAISGYNSLLNPTTPDSYRFSSITHGWGWATWKRTWDLYPKNFANKNVLPTTKEFKRHFDSNWFEAFQLKRIFTSIAKDKLDAWDYQFLYMAMKMDKYCAVSNSNLVENIGFGAKSTHTKDKPSYLLGQQEMIFPLRHPELVRDRVADRWVLHNAYGLNLKYVISRIPKKIMGK